MSELRRNLQINGVTYHLAVNQYGAGVPGESTIGKPGVLYMDTETGTLYKCLTAENNRYHWELAVPDASIEPVAKTGEMAQPVGVDANGKLWTRYISGCLHAADIAGGGAAKLNVPLDSIQLMDTHYAITFGDKIITGDGFLYEITGISLGGETAYTAELICGMGGGTGDSAGTDVLLVSYGDGVTASHNAAQIHAACDAGKAVFLVGTGGGPIPVSPTMVSDSYAEFNGYAPDSAGKFMHVCVFTIDGNAAVSFSLKKYCTIPNPSQAEDGQVLQVADGSAAWVDGGHSGYVPEYWKESLDTAAAAINGAITEAGCNKAAFLCYADAHWTYNAQVSPKLLNYLYRHTAMNKVVFCGDIVDNEEDVSYLWQWREAIRNLPNHHSVVGNHDDGNATNNLFSEKYVYGFLLAPEETADVVRGDSGLYYYIDSPCEKTRYLYLDTAYQGVTSGQRTFVANALKTTPDGWHIVAVSHIWHDADYTTTPVTVGDINAQAKILLDMFDDYNGRTGDYADCGGWVEFCIGGHTHMDHSSYSDSGIPIILICTDSQHTRSGTAYEAGTIKESAVAGVIADYDNHRITIVGVGRCSSKWLVYDGSIDNGGNDSGAFTNVLDTVGYTADMEVSVSDGTERTSENGCDLTGFIALAANDVVRLKNIIMPDNVTDRRNYIYLYDADKNIVGNIICTSTDTLTGAENLKPVFEDGNLVQFTNPAYPSWTYIRINAQQIDNTSIITINEEIDGGAGGGDSGGGGESGGDTENYTNVLDTVGYQADREVSTSSGSERDSTGGYDLTGYIPVAANDVIRLKNIIMPDEVTDRRNYIYLYDSSNGYVGHINCTTTDTATGALNLSPVFEGGNLARITMPVSLNWAYIRINAQQIDDTSIITINEEIV